MELANNNVGAIAAQHVGLGCRGHLTRLVRVAKDELTGLEWALHMIGTGNRAALNGRLTDPVLEAEGLASRRQNAGILAIDHLDALDGRVCLLNPLE